MAIAKNVTALFGYGFVRQNLMDALTVSVNINVSYFSYKQRATFIGQLIIPNLANNYIAKLYKVLEIYMGYWPSVRSRWLDIGHVLMDRDEVEAQTHVKKNEPISSYLDRTTLINKGFIIGNKTPKHEKFSLRDKARVPRRQDSSILPTRVANYSARFGSSCPLTKLVI